MTRHPNLLTSILTAAVLSLGGTCRLAAQRPTPSGVSLSVGALHSDEAGLGVSVTGSYVISNRALSLSLSPADLGLSPPNARYQQESSPTVGAEPVCRDREIRVQVSDVRCNASVRYGASVQLLGLLVSDSTNTIGLGLGFRAFDAAGPFAAASFDLATVRAARVQLRARSGTKFWDVALGATVSLDRWGVRPKEPAY
jgi:hypothetical protein